MELLTEKYQDKISGVISCFDRIVITGTIPGICYSQGMTSYLYSKGIKIFDYPKFAEPLRDKIRANAQKIALENNVEIEFVRKSHIRKEDLVARKLKERGSQEGLVHILSAMESCSSYQPWHNKQTGKTFLKGSQSKCLHYYFYFIDPYLGLGYIRVPTWCPFKLQVYFNGHSLLAKELDKAGIAYTMLDNAFDSIADFNQAQQIADGLDVERIHKRLDGLASKYCGMHFYFNQVYHWSVMQVEYATDIVFKKQDDLQAMYSDLISTAIHTVKPENISTFLGKKLDPRYQGEIGNNYNVRIEGSRIKHKMGKQSIKMYDKFAKILRIETTSNDIGFFKHYRKVEHRDGRNTRKYTSLKKNIYSMVPLQAILKSSNKRYLEFISAIENTENGRKRLEKISQPTIVKQRKYKGFNLFDKTHLDLLMSILNGGFNIYGFRNKDIRNILPDFSSSKISRLFKSLRVHGLIKKAGKSYKYFATKLAKETVILGEKIKNIVMIPHLNY